MQYKTKGKFRRFIKGALQTNNAVGKKKAITYFIFINCLQAIL